MSFQLANGDLGYDGIPVTLNYFAGLPDPSILSDANITILFKSLLKKDSITKEKSLNDLLETLTAEASSASGGSPYADDLTVISWIQLYPKLAIDNSRTVRILAHQVQAKFLELLGGKSFSRYLKSSIPVWLHGLFDNDRVVATATYKSLLSSFQNEKEKIDKLWVLFYEQIVNFIVTSVALESPESLSDKRYTKESDLYAKYERVLGGSLSMLNKLIQISSTAQPSKTDDSKVIAKEIEKLLNLEKLWDYLGSTLVSETLNLGLFKTLLVLIKSLFNSSSEPFIAQLKDAKGLFKLIAKKFIKHVKFKSSKPTTSSSNVVYSNVILQLWDTLSHVTEFTSLPLAKTLKIKKSFWELGGSKSESRLIEYLKLGHCNSDPTYYAILSHFFEILVKNEALQKSASKGSEESNSDSEDSDIAYRNEIVLKTIRKQFKSLTTFDFKEKAFDSFLKIHFIFEDNLNGAEPLQFVSYSSLDLLAKIRPRKPEVPRYERLVSALNSFIEVGISKHKDVGSNILDAIDQFIKEGEKSEFEKPLNVLGFEIESSPTSFFETYFDVLTKTQSKLLDQTVPELSKRVEDSLVEGDQPENPAIAFKYFSVYLKNGPNVTDSSVSSIFELIPSFVEQDFIEPPLELFRDFLNTPFSLPSDPEVKEVINDFYLKLTMVAPGSSWISEFLLTVSETRKLSPDSYPEIYQHVLEVSQNQALSKSDSNLVYTFVNDPQILENLLESASSSEEKSREFISKIGKFDTTNIEQSQYLQRILNNSWSGIEKPEVRQFFNSISSELIEESLLELISASSISTNLVPIAEYFKERSFDSGKLFSYLKPALSSISDNSLALSNPIEHNIALVELSHKSESQINKSLLLVYGKFVLELIRLQPHEYNLILLSSYIAEYLNDYLFLESQIENDDTILTLKSDLLASSKETFVGITFDQILSKDEDSVVGRIIVSLIGDMKSNSFNAFYSARVYKQIADLVFDALTLQGFEESSINFNQLVGSPLQLSVFLLCGSKFFTKSNKFDRIRNYVAAEILGVKKESQILSDGLKWITLINNFFTSEEPYEVIPPHRLAMVINQISSWLDSDIAYDQDFIVLRVQLAKFFASLISSGVSLPDKIWELTIRLVNDNLSTSQGEIDRLDLRYFTFKLVLAVLKVAKSQTIEEWNDGKESIFEEFVDILTNREMTIEDTKKNNQAVDLVHALSQRIFQGIEITSKLANDKLENLYSVLQTGNFIPLQVIAVSILEQVILKNQSDFVVEYQLQKSRLGDDPELTEYKAILNETLISNIQGEVDDIESENLPFVARYLWSWYLIFTHFEDITISIRSEYINQLKEFGAINALFEYIFEQVDVGDTKLVQKLVGTEGNVSFQSYTPSVGFSGESIEFEFKFLLLHLYYLSFRFLGSQVQTWYKEIRDRQLKQRIEKFSAKYVSPLLIDKILNEVATAKMSLQSKDENLTIKVNTVTNEIKSTYVIDEQTMEMVIKVPTVYPLENVTVNGPLRLGVKENQWKAWLLASQRVISLTNGSIMEAIELFNKNVNLHFSGFEECAICYSILHQDLSLPSKTCSTCSNKFHAACLYKWFKSSGSSTCPLCRSAFNFRPTREALRA